jgi:hypothetical protein
MKTYTLTLSEQHLMVISDALMSGPFGRVAPVVQTINEQLQKAQQPQPQQPQENATHVEGAWVPAMGGIHE